MRIVTISDMIIMRCLILFCKLESVLNDHIAIDYPYHVLISNATINNSLKINAVNDIDTMWMNSSSNKRMDRIIIAPPARLRSLYHLKVYSSILRVNLRTLINANQEPSKECSVGK